MMPKLSRDKKPSAQITRSDGETERRSDGATERRGDGATETMPISLSVSPSLCLSVSLSSRRPVAPSPRLFFPPSLITSNRRRQRDLAPGVIVNVIGDHYRRVRNAFVAGEVVNIHYVWSAVAFDDVEAV